MSQNVSNEFTDNVTAKLALVEEELSRQAGADTPFVTEAANHIISAGGKRFRPLLVTLCSQFGKPVADVDLVRAAVVMELTHVASLYHDDVMDEASIRRGAESANSRWGNSVAIMVGDFLFARASETVAKLGTEYVALQARTFSRLVQGQIAETRGPQPDEDPLEHYLQVVSDKTASLISAAAVFGAMVSDASAEIVESLREFGEQIGSVFQLSDDIIDITSTRTGKTPGTDLREGVATLPTLMLQASTDPADDELKDLLTADLMDQHNLDRALAGLRASHVIDEARAVVQRRADLARGHLAILPAGDARTALETLCDEVVSRSS
ncbi:polyprenyl synthetase family protein [Cutibacterium granulosum]|uniref:polyprenyl synthetase family protein n=1 Tax=Cutibacterium granulosum TaxID=33011 RepID=UPI000DB80AD9|nr:polyprenyl synthetase family protein [Cutibacterium granulosum]MEA5648443.1 polyprenyl synthetase family protein [Cutibacterium granulosum]MEA5653674.1 polyprenyl synthetase family protein [Cutibacterium granulosum]MEA5655600.1 polyprenyl synthetase family protein [Cutibacterium granulosum]MEA5662879.1 polyprenyl synthetase family protein [Cutibacterium granulosum]MEA5664641.1 polyprenyl synthetase family protein [Cutibacterium granulosum]